MKLKEFIRQEIDIDIVDDLTEDCYIAFCGPCSLTEEGEKYFEEVMNLDILIYDDIAVIHCESEKEVKLCRILFHGFAGFIPSNRWNKWFAK